MRSLKQIYQYKASADYGRWLRAFSVARGDPSTTATIEQALAALAAAEGYAPPPVRCRPSTWSREAATAAERPRSR